MADDWRELAKKEGFAFIPSQEMDAMKGAVKALGEFRSLVPEEYRGKEPDFFKDAMTSMVELKKIKETGKGELEATKGELVSLKGNLTKKENELTATKAQVDALTKQNTALLMWGHVARVQQVKNVRVHDRILNTFENDIVNFPMKDYDLTKDEGQKSFMDAVYKKILEPALKVQTEISGQLPAGSSADSNTNTNNTEPTKPKVVFGSLA